MYRQFFCMTEIWASLATVRIFVVEILLWTTYCICMQLYLLSLIEHSLLLIVVVLGMPCVCLMQNLYDMLLKLLEERGIDGDFVDQLTEFSTSYEHNNYVDTLEQLRDFVASK